MSFKFEIAGDLKIKSNLAIVETDALINRGGLLNKNGPFSEDAFSATGEIKLTGKAHGVFQLLGDTPTATRVTIFIINNRLNIDKSICMSFFSIQILVCSGFLYCKHDSIIYGKFPLLVKSNNDRNYKHINTYFSHETIST